ncbi:methyltransferase domain-containing protein [Gordonia sp. CPCC 205333]|uniref:methyltransferase domain-containing protein n=1 Tax=Gordonia sp. CPCC 205333 TaxID=3140790 RepID=UPI003AF3F8EF
MTTPITEPAREQAVYRPQADTLLLLEALAHCRLTADDSVADLCTGSGVIARQAARNGAGIVVAVDDCPNSIAHAKRVNDRTGLSDHITTICGDISTLPARPTFNLVTCNPPYVPTPPNADPALHPPGPSHSWDAGPDGRLVLDAVCSIGPRLLRPGGAMLIVQSEFADVAATSRQLIAAGMAVRIVTQARIPFGPVLIARAKWLEAQELLEHGCRTELLVVIEATAP